MKSGFHRFTRSATPSSEAARVGPSAAAPKSPIAATTTESAETVKVKTKLEVPRTNDITASPTERIEARPNFKGLPWVGVAKLHPDSPGSAEARPVSTAGAGSRGTSWAEGEGGNMGCSKKGRPRDGADLRL